MSRKITLAILSLIISASVILTPSLSASAYTFGSLSFNDDAMKSFWYNNQAKESTANYPGYHIQFTGNVEICTKIQLTSAMVSSSLIRVLVPFQGVKYFFVVKSTSGVQTQLDRRVSQFAPNTYSSDIVWLGMTRITWEMKNGNNITYSSRSDSFITGCVMDSNYKYWNNREWINNHNLPVYVWFGSYNYIIMPVVVGTDFNNANYSLMRYESTKYSELKAEELEGVSQALDDAGIDVGAIESLGGFSSEPESTTVPAVDASSESEQFSEDFSGIDEMISNIDDFSELASSNLAEVSGVMSNTRSALDKVLEWLPRPIIILCIFGLVALIIVKIMGR